MSYLIRYGTFVPNFTWKVRGFVTTTQSFGQLLRPRDKLEKIRHEEIFGKIPYDMADSWFERKEILMKNKMEVMPEQFAEAKLKYSLNEVDFLLNCLLNQCLEKDSKTKYNFKKLRFNHDYKLEEKGFMDNIIERLNESLNYFNGSECGIVLKCLDKLNIDDNNLKIKLINKILSRSESFTKYGLISSLNTLEYLINTKKNDENFNEYIRLFNSTLSIIVSKLDKFEITLISQIVNVVSRVNINVNYQLKQISNYIIEKYSSIYSIFMENDVYYLTNGFSRKNILNKTLFDLFNKVVSENCSTYSMDTLTSISNSYSKFGSASDSGYLDLFCKVADQVIVKLEHLNSLHVAVLSNAFSKALLCHEHLFKVLLDKFTLTYHTFTPRQVAMILHSVSKVQYNSSLLSHLFQKAIQDLQIYCWHSLTMLFQSYIKSDHVDQVTTRKFCDHFYERFLEFKKCKEPETLKFKGLDSCSDTLTSVGIDSEYNLEFNEEIENVKGLNKITLLSLIYSLVKSNTYYHVDLLYLLSKEIFDRIEEYSGDELANLVYSSGKIYVYAKKNSLESLVQICDQNLRKLVELVSSSINQFGTFSIIKMTQSFGEARFLLASDLVIRMIKFNVSNLHRLSYLQLNSIINSLSTLGINDIDVMTVLNTIKHRKKIK